MTPAIRGVTNARRRSGRLCCKRSATRTFQEKRAPWEKRTLRENRASQKNRTVSGVLPKVGSARKSTAMPGADVGRGVGVIVGVAVLVGVRVGVGVSVGVAVLVGVGVGVGVGNCNCEL